MGSIPGEKRISESGDPQAEPGWLNRFVESVWSPLVVIMTGLAAAYTFISGQIDELREETEGVKRATLEAEERISLEEKSINQTYVLEVTQMVIDSIRDKDTDTQQILLTVVETVPDPKIAKALAEKLSASEDAEIQRQATEVVENAEAEIERQAQALRTLPPLKSVDVRYCDFGAKKSSNRRQAERIEKFFVDMNERNFEGYRLSSSILTPMDSGRARRLSPNLGSSYLDIRYDRDDPGEQAFVREVASRVRSELGINLNLQPVGTQSRNSFSVFICS